MQVWQKVGWDPVSGRRKSGLGPNLRGNKTVSEPLNDPASALKQQCETDIGQAEVKRHFPVDHPMPAHWVGAGSSRVG